MIGTTPRALDDSRSLLAPSAIAVLETHVDLRRWRSPATPEQPPVVTGVRRRGQTRRAAFARGRRSPWPAIRRRRRGRVAGTRLVSADGIPESSRRRVNGFLGSMHGASLGSGPALGTVSCCRSATVVQLCSVTPGGRDVVARRSCCHTTAVRVPTTVAVGHSYGPFHGPTPTVVGKRTHRPLPEPPTPTVVGKRTPPTPDTPPRPWSENARHRPPARPGADLSGAGAC